MPNHPKSESIHNALDSLLVDLHRLSRGRGQKADVLGVVWRATVGEFLARNARPLSLAGGRLRVGVTSASLREEMQGMEIDLLDRLNRSGQLKVDSIILEMVPKLERAPDLRLSEPPPVPQAPEPIPEDELPLIRPELQATLHRLLAHHRQHRSLSTRKA